MRSFNFRLWAPIAGAVVLGAFLYAGGAVAAGGASGAGSEDERDKPLADGVIRTLTGTIKCLEHDGFQRGGGHRPVFELRGEGRGWYRLLENSTLEEIEALAGSFHPMEEDGAGAEVRPSNPEDHRPVKVRGRFSLYRGENFLRITTLVKVLESLDEGAGDD